MIDMYGYVDFPHLRTDIDNGITMCEECHKEYHSTYGKRAYGLHFIDFISRKEALDGVQ